MQKFCPNCGAPITSGTYCDACTSLEPYDSVTIKLCPSRRYQLRGSWSSYERPDEVVEAVVDDVAPDTSIVEVSHNLDRLRHRMGESFDVRVVVDVEGVEHVIPLSVLVRPSPTWKRQQPSGKAAVVQLRDLDVVGHEGLHDALTSLPEDASLIAIEELSEGVDLTWGDAGDARSFGDMLAAQYGAEITVSRTLHTVDDMSSKRVYRTTFLVRFVSFESGDVISLDDEPWFVESVGNQVHLFGLRNGESRVERPGSLQNVETLEKHKATVGETQPELHVLHPTTYQEVMTWNAKEFDVTNGQTVTVVAFDDEVFICND